MTDLGMVPKTQAARRIIDDEPRRPSPNNVVEMKAMRSAATDLALSLSWLRGTPSSDMLSVRCESLVAAFKSVFVKVESAFAQALESEDLLWLRNNAQQLASAARLILNELGPLTNLPIVSSKDEILPRVLALTEGFIKQAKDVSKEQFTEFCLVFEETTPLEYHEIGALVPALKLVLLEKIAELAGEVLKNSASESRVVPYIRIFQHVTQASWKDELESMIPFDGILREDPVGAYAAMNLESRNVYRETVARLAHRSDLSELEIAKEALKLARQAQKRKYADSRIAMRESHIGYYLVGEGAT